MSDVRTLKLASITITPERVRAFMTYQRTLVNELSAPGGGDWAGRVAFAHGRGLAESGLDILSQQQLRAAVADFCGRRSTVMALKEKLATPPTTDAEKERHARAVRELPKLESLSEFEERYGTESLAALRAEEAELVRLHRRLAQLEGAGGHLHLA
ncbi:MAG: hypothetical protein JNG84_04790 [Archangium sp.]|nr:hypothetical protein [Archangium sp.]